MLIGCEYCNPPEGTPEPTTKTQIVLQCLSETYGWLDNTTLNIIKDGEELRKYIDYLNTTIGGRKYRAIERTIITKDKVIYEP